MAIDLEHTLAWQRATGSAQVMLNELQANILTPHVRDEMAVLLIEFTGDRAREFLRALAPLVKSAATHLREVELYRSSPQERRVPASTYVGVGLSSAGYGALGLPPEERPADGPFRRGMKDPVSRDQLADPPSERWEKRYQRPIHAVVLIGAGTSSAGDAAKDLVRAAERQVRAVLGRDARVVGWERGTGTKNGYGQGVEHFGYVDGISQPLFLEEDVHRAGYKRVKFRRTPLREVLVRDPGVQAPPAWGDVFYGSYLVFRKLEQNVRRFKQAEEDLYQALGLDPKHEKRPGALVVGRFEDGTPIRLRPDDGQAPSSPINDFNYLHDGLGKRCPLSAHIRRMNPRDNTQIPLARRGQTYGRRDDDPTDRSVAPGDRPEAGVGLLFMAFNASNDRQFVAIQQRLANGALDDGSDPLIGQGDIERTYAFNRTWNRGTRAVAFHFPQTVTMKGGEYFFMPSIAFLRAI